MPEGDTVRLVATKLDAALAGERITSFDVRTPKFALADLRGHVVTEVTARGKHLLLRTDGGATLHSHLKMEGEWHVYEIGERWRGPGFEARVVIETARAQAVGFRLAEVAVVETAREEELVGHLGPDPYGPDWDPDEVVRRIAAEPPDRPIGEVLLDQRVLAGIGNVYKSEICFLRGLYPWTPVGEVQDARAIADLTKRLFDVNRTLGRQVTTGNLRRGMERWVYGRAAKPCRRCGTRIEVRDRARSDARVTYWCPRCQPERRGATP